MKRIMKTTLNIIEVDDKLLMGIKRRGFGAGKINGVGGKLEPGETFINAVIRETKEEIDVVPINPKEVGVIEFDEVVKGERCTVEMHIFVSEGFEGEPKESDEITPHFVDRNNIPYEKMFADDRVWLPELLAGRKFKGQFAYDDNLVLTNIKIDFFD